MLKSRSSRLPRMMSKIGAMFALVMGVAIAWVDTRPGWDDTGVTAGVLLVVAGASALSGVRWWLAAGLVALPLVVAEAPGAGWGLAAAPMFSVFGAAGGALLRRVGSDAGE